MFSYGHVKTELFVNDNVTRPNATAIVFGKFLVFIGYMWTAGNNEKNKMKFWVFKRKGYLWTGENEPKTLRVDRESFDTGTETCIFSIENGVIVSFLRTS